MTYLLFLSMLSTIIMDFQNKTPDSLPKCEILARARLTTRVYYVRHVKIDFIFSRYFPKIFGPNEDQGLDEEATTKQFDRLTKDVNLFLQQQDGPAFKPMTATEIAMGYIRVANEAMCRPIRALTQVH